MPARKSENPFNLLLEDINSGKTKAGTGFNFGKLLKSNNKRTEIRTKAFGNVDVYDVENKLITKAVLRNVSPGGLGLEIHPTVLKPEMKLLIELGGAIAEFGRIKCTVSWVASIDNHFNNHKMIGLRFDSTSAVFRAKMESFIATLSAIK